MFLVIYFFLVLFFLFTKKKCVACFVLLKWFVNNNKYDIQIWCFLFFFTKWQKERGICFLFFLYFLFLLFVFVCMCIICIVFCFVFSLIAFLLFFVSFLRKNGRRKEKAEQQRKDQRGWEINGNKFDPCIQNNGENGNLIYLWFFIWIINSFCWYNMNILWQLMIIWSNIFFMIEVKS